MKWRPRAGEGPRLAMADGRRPGGQPHDMESHRSGKDGFHRYQQAGSTAETMANFLFFWDRLKVDLGPKNAAGHVVVITDEEKGVLRPFADEIGCRSLVLPATWEGASPSCRLWAFSRPAPWGPRPGNRSRAQRRWRRSSTPWTLVFDNPAPPHGGAFRGPLPPGTEHDRPYALRGCPRTLLRMACSAWGRKPRKERDGSTPVRALGAIDQHSQIQLYTGKAPTTSFSRS